MGSKTSRSHTKLSASCHAISPTRWWRRSMPVPIFSLARTHPNGWHTGEHCYWEREWCIQCFARPQKRIPQCSSSISALRYEFLYTGLSFQNDTPPGTLSAFYNGHWSVFWCQIPNKKWWTKVLSCLWSRLDLICRLAPILRSLCMEMMAEQSPIWVHSWGVQHQLKFYNWMFYKYTWLSWAITIWLLDSLSSAVSYLRYEQAASHSSHTKQTGAKTFTISDLVKICIYALLFLQLSLCFLFWNLLVQAITGPIAL